MSALQPTNSSAISQENITKIFETEKKKLKQDILFLKEDVLKDFRQIESKLNTKIENQNSNLFKQIEKFDISLDSMNNKIAQLSTLISTDKNMQEKISQLYEFKSKLDEEIVTQKISIKNINSELKTAINNYDKLFSNSIIYPGVIGPNSKFSTFHELIDYILLNINQLSTFRDKNLLDLKSYKTKLESLVKSFKMQADSIMMNTTEFTNKKINDLEKKFQTLFKNQESAIVDLNTESNKLNLSFDKLTKEIKSEQYKKLDSEINILKYYNNIIMNKCEDYDNEFKLIKKQLNNIKLNTNDEPNQDEYQKRNRNNSQYARNDFMARSIVKKYILGELGIKDIKHPIKRQKSIIDNDMNIKNKLFMNNQPKKPFIKQLNKRMTLGPNNISLRKIQNNLAKINNNIDNSTYSDQSVSKSNNKSLNNINEEKEEDIDYINIYKEKEKDKIHKSPIVKNKLINENIKENEKENLSSSLYEEVDSNSENKNNDNKNKDVHINNDKNKNIKNEEEIKKDVIKNDFKKNIKDEDIINKINKENLKTISYKNEKDNYMKNIINDSFRKIIENPNANTNEKKIFENKLQKRLANTTDKFFKLDNDSNSNIKKLANSNIQAIKKYNQASMPLRPNQSHHYLNLKKNKNSAKLNIIEINFDEANSFIKGNEKMKKIVNNIKDIKDLRNNIAMERNRTIEKNKIYRKLKMDKMDNSEFNYDNNSERIIINNNLGNNYYYNMLVKEDLLNYSSADYLYFIHRNKIKKHINPKKNK